MSLSLNRVFLGGNVTRDPELRHTPGGMPVLDLGLAINEKKKNPDGQYEDSVVFVDCTAFQRTAEIAAQYLTKGSPALIEGKLRLDSWTTNDGQKRSKLKIVIDRLHLIGPKQTPTEDAYSAPAPAAPSQWEVDAAKELAADAADTGPPRDDDCPF